MSTYRKLTEVFKNAVEIPFDDNSKLVLISDCHRGDGSWVDNFAQNRNLYYAAIKYYFEQSFTYIELGDGDELWKNRNFSDISGVYEDILRMLRSFYKDNRLYLIYGNHDIVKKDPKYVEKYMKTYYNRSTDKYEPLFDCGITVHEGIVLRHRLTQAKVFLVHGHQGDLLDDTFWPVGRFLVRHLWRRLELFGFKDITSAAINTQKKKRVERKISEWAADNNQIVIAGHTHRPTCMPERSPFYYNDGSCVHPNSITCMEIVKSEITLVKWSIRTEADRSLYVSRKVIAVPKKL